ncbi:conserved hypothetical protein [Beggiatoa sp. PS]|nr:conserved hypothetical protein [Beggiatoa sp. PS]
MLQTYKAVLKDNHLEWLDEKNVSVSSQPILVHVTLLEDEPIPKPTFPSQSAVDILEEIACLNGAVSKITDPVAWQREIRQDRPLPFREDD